MSRLALVLSDQAEADLIDIWAYIAKDSPTIADAFTDQIYERCQLLAENPKLGRRRPELGEDLYSFPFRRYVIYYRVEQESVQIARVLSAYQDLDSLL